MHSNLLTIKQFSKLTNTHPKSLRYYDELGILKPIYVNPENGYRYYSIFQVELVYTIKICTEVNVPLKTLFSYENNNTIHYKNLSELFISSLEQKIKHCEKLLSQSRNYFNQLLSAESRLKSDKPTYQYFDSFYCLITPYQGVQHSDEWEKAMADFLLKFYESNYEIGYNTGICRILKDGIWNQYLFISISHLSDIPLGTDHILSIPAGNYLCNNVSTSNLDYAMEWTKDYIDPHKLSIIIETELLVNDYTLFPPPLEHRCFIDSP